MKNRVYFQLWESSKLALIGELCNLAQIITINFAKNYCRNIQILFHLGIMIISKGLNIKIKESVLNIINSNKIRSNM